MNPYNDLTIDKVLVLLHLIKKCVSSLDHENPLCHLSVVVFHVKFGCIKKSETKEWKNREWRWLRKSYKKANSGALKMNRDPFRTLSTAFPAKEKGKKKTGLPYRGVNCNWRFKHAISLLTVDEFWFYPLLYLQLTISALQLYLHLIGKSLTQQRVWFKENRVQQLFVYLNKKCGIEKKLWHCPIR